MATEGSTESGTPSAAGSTLAIPNLKALLKESLAEILAESPSLLHPPTHTPHGEYRSSSRSPWRGCRTVVVAELPAGVAEWRPRWRHGEEAGGLFCGPVGGPSPPFWPVGCSHTPPPLPSPPLLSFCEPHAQWAVWERCQRGMWSRVSTCPA